MKFRNAARIASIYAFMTFLLPAATANASGVVRYVSTSGVNTNDCTRAAPCRTIDGALLKTPVFGEIRVLESGFYGSTATISKSVTLSGERPDVSLSRLALSVTDLQGRVMIRNIQFLGGESVPFGITISTGIVVRLENVVVQGFTSVGVLVTSNGTTISVVDSAIRNNFGSGMALINAVASRITISGSSFTNNNAGVSIDNGSTGTIATIAKSLFHGNSAVGLQVGGSSIVIVDTSYLVSNGASGIAAFGGTTRLSNVTISFNALGVNQSGGTVVSRQNNSIIANGLDVSGPPLATFGPL